MDTKNTQPETAEREPELRGYWRQNTYEGHSHSYTLVVGQLIKDFATYGQLCDYCKANNITAQLA